MHQETIPMHHSPPKKQKHHVDCIAKYSIQVIDPCALILFRHAYDFTIHLMILFMEKKVEKAFNDLVTRAYRIHV